MPADTSDAPAATGTHVQVDISKLRDISPMLYGQNYYNWIPAWGAQVLEVKDLVAPLHLNLLREGGAPSDVSTPVMFGFADADTFVRYAADVGAQPYIQIPFVGMRSSAGELLSATSQNAAEMVRYLNVTNNYRVRYFSIGNEPDIYETQGLKIGGQSTTGYTAKQYCSGFTEFVNAMKGVDPTIQIMGPELSWKYRGGASDWITPFLRTCGKLVDIVSIHYYPFDATQDTAEAVLANHDAFRTTILQVRQHMKDAGYPDKPLAITESGVSWDDDPSKEQLSGAPGSTAAGLWTADALGIAMEEGLWTLAFWSLSEAWTLGIIDGRTPKPEYYALLAIGQHFRTKIATVSGAPKTVSVYGGRNDNSTSVLLVNRSSDGQDVIVSITGGSTPVPDVTLTVPSLSFVIVEIADRGGPSATVYGDAQHTLGIGPQPHALGIAPPSLDASAPPDVSSNVPKDVSRDFYSITDVSVD
jgi:hypothetical protein